MDRTPFYSRPMVLRKITFGSERIKKLVKFSLPVMLGALDTIERKIPDMTSVDHARQIIKAAHEELERTKSALAEEHQRLKTMLDSAGLDVSELKYTKYCQWDIQISSPGAISALQLVENSKEACAAVDMLFIANVLDSNAKITRTAAIERFFTKLTDDLFKLSSSMWNALLDERRKKRTRTQENAGQKQATVTVQEFPSSASNPGEVEGGLIAIKDEDTHTEADGIADATGGTEEAEPQADETATETPVKAVKKPAKKRG